MAKIPTGNFGNNFANGSSAARLTPAAFDSGSGLAQAGDTLMRIAGNAVAEERQEQIQIGRERDQLVMQALREEEQQQKALKKAQAGNAVLDYEIQVDAASKSIEDQVRDGTLSYADALPAYNKTIEKVGMPDMTGYDPVDTENLTKSIRRIGFKGQQSMYKVAETGRATELKAKTDQMFDTLGKAAGLPGADMGQITARADAMDDVGQQAFGAAWGKKKQDWKDSAWDANLNQQAMAVSNDINGINALSKEITQGQYADKLDSNKRNSLVAKLGVFKTSLIQRNEAAAQRVQRQQEKHLNEAKAEFETYQAMSDKGLYVDPAYATQVIQKTAGTPYQQAVVSLNKNAQETGGLASQPITVQKQTLAAIDAQIAKSGRTPELDKRRDQVSKVYTASQADLKNDGIRAGAERGVIAGLEPLDTSSPAAITTSIAKRVQAAGIVSAWAGFAVSPLDNDEAGNVRSVLEVLPPKERSQAIATMSSTVGPKFASAIAQQIDKQNRALGLAFKSASSNTTAGRYTSELILSGEQALKDGVVMKDDTKVTGTKARIAYQVDGLFPSQTITNDAKDAAYLIVSGIAKESNGSIGKAEIEKAVNMAIGGSVIEHNNKRLPIPAGVDEDSFNTRINTVSGDELKQQAPDGLVRVGGVLLSTNDLAKSLPGQELAYAAPGKYWVMVQGRQVTNSQGKPILIKVN